MCINNSHNIIKNLNLHLKTFASVFFHVFLSSLNSLIIHETCIAGLVIFTMGWYDTEAQLMLKFLAIFACGPSKNFHFETYSRKRVHIFSKKDLTLIILDGHKTLFCVCLHHTLLYWRQPC